MTNVNLLFLNVPTVINCHVWHDGRVRIVPCPLFGPMTAFACQNRHIVALWPLATCQSKHATNTHHGCQISISTSPNCNLSLSLAQWEGWKDTMSSVLLICLTLRSQIYLLLTTKTIAKQKWSTSDWQFYVSQLQSLIIFGMMEELKWCPVSWSPVFLTAVCPNFPSSALWPLTTCQTMCWTPTINVKMACPNVPTVVCCIIFSGTIERFEGSPWSCFANFWSLWSQIHPILHSEL